MTALLVQADARAIPLRDESVQTVVTSPPYWGLRHYGTEGQLGLERTYPEFVKNLVEVFREVRRVLRPDGTVWLNLGDCWYSGDRGSYQKDEYRWCGSGFQEDRADRGGSGIPLAPNRLEQPGLKDKDLVGIPWRVALALQDDGWWLRADIIWCLSGGTVVYARTDSGGICLATIKDLARLKPETVRLWNGREWTRLLGVSKSPRRGDEVTITLRSGERISCTPTHRFPIYGGAKVVPASDLRVGMVLTRCELPSPAIPLDTPEVGEDAAWFCGLYLAEGSRSGETIQIAGHAKEEWRWERVRRIALKYGGSATRTVKGSNMSIRVYGKILDGILRQFVNGRTAHDKGFAPAAWRCSNSFLRSMLDGYLHGDGHRDEKNDRWRIGFCRNYALERDLRTACARLGYRLTLKMSWATGFGRRWPSFRGEIRTHQRVHPNCKNPDEIVSIEKSKGRFYYDIGVADEPHLFALASGILTHNSKPNGMPESIEDRPSKHHEYIFLLAKSGTANLWRHRETRKWTKERPEPDYRWVNRLTGEVVKEPPEAWETTLIEVKKGVFRHLWRRRNLWKGFDYYFDMDAVKEDASWLGQNRETDPGQHRYTGEQEGAPHLPRHAGLHKPGFDGPRGFDTKRRAPEERDRASLKQDEVVDGRGVVDGRYAGFNARWKRKASRDSFKRDQSKRADPQHGSRTGTHRPDREDKAYNGPQRNLRAVWSIPTQPTREKHFATYPEALVERCILAGAPKGGVVLDPFAGSGTTVRVARRLGRVGVGLDLSMDYLQKIARKRIRGVQMDLLA